MLRNAACRQWWSHRLHMGTWQIVAMGDGLAACHNNSFATSRPFCWISSLGGMNSCRRHIDVTLVPYKTTTPCCCKDVLSLCSLLGAVGASMCSGVSKPAELVSCQVVTAFCVVNNEYQLASVLTLRPEGAQALRHSTSGGHATI